MYDISDNFNFYVIAYLNFFEENHVLIIQLSHRQHTIFKMNYHKQAE